MNQDYDQYYQEGNQCHGIYFDNGELQILLESQEQKGFLGILRKVF